MVITDTTSARDLLMPSPLLMPKLITHTSHTAVMASHTLTVILMPSVPELSATNMSAPQQLPTESTNCTSVMPKLMPIQRHTTVMAVVMVMAVDTVTDTHTAMLATDMADTHTVRPDTEDTDTVADTTDKRLVNLFSTNVVFFKKNLSAFQPVF